MIPLLRDYALIFAGVILQALSMVLFYIPGNLAAGGVSGIAQLIGNFTGWPIGTLYIVLNVPLLALGWRFLGGRRFLVRTIFAVLGYSIAMDVLTIVLPKNGLTSDSILNALYGGVIGGIGVGLVLRGQGTTGGTDILVRLLNIWRGIPYSQTYIATDVFVVFTAGLSFGWTLALYAVVAMYVGGIAAEFAAEGVRTTRTVLIITTNPQPVAQRVLDELQRGITMWQGTGMYSSQERQILLCTVSRAEINPIKAIVHEADPKAFVVIGEAYEAFGEGFKSLKPM
ncbi:MAG TPA: YitT family protein [Anaerolineae bacterium]|nr:YitT family protein [Anaerolineae bacterium]